MKDRELFILQLREYAAAAAQSYIADTVAGFERQVKDKIAAAYRSSKLFYGTAPTHDFGSGPELVWDRDDLVLEWRF